MKRKNLVFINVIFLLLILSGCATTASPEWVFSMPENITPDELESKGFETMMDNGVHCMLDTEDIFVSVGFTTSNKMEHCGITTSETIFKNISDLEPADYDSVVIKNYNYKITHYVESHQVFASRLGL